jgi:hypothetical protein
MPFYTFTVSTCCASLQHQIWISLNLHTCIVIGALGFGCEVGVAVLLGTTCRERRCRWDAAHGTGTTSYTGIAEVAPGVVLLAYDKTSGAGRSGDLQKIYSVRIELTSAENADLDSMLHAKRVGRVARACCTLDFHPRIAGRAANTNHRRLSNLISRQPANYFRRV